MRSVTRFPYRYLLLIGVGVVALGCGVLGFLLRQAPAQPSELQAARMRWAAQPITWYRLVVEERNEVENCTYDVEVQDEQVVTVVVTDTRAIWPCDHVPTVTRLFDRLSALDGTCGANGCACDGPLRVQAVYDRRWGYPHYATWASNPEERWRYLAYWNPLNACTMIGFIKTEITVRSLTPLP